MPENRIGAGIRFSVIGLNHGHIYLQVEALLEAGGEFVSYYADEPELVEPFAKRYPHARLARCPEEILQDPGIQLVASASIPNERAPLGISVMQHGKDFMVDKPGFTTLEQLAEARRAQVETGRIYSVFYCERLANPATVKAGELVQQGAIGRVIQTVGLGPHQLNARKRPDWFFRRERYGGILTDIGSHQVDQFLFFTGAKTAEITLAQVANFHHPEYPELEDWGEIALAGGGSAGYIRVDWFTPDGLGAWGDGRLMILGTEGTLEVRKVIDIGGHSGDNHLFLVDGRGIQYLDCRNVPCPYGRRLLEDVVNRTETAMTQEHCFMASEIALKAQAGARQLSG